MEMNASSYRTKFLVFFFVATFLVAMVSVVALPLYSSPKLSTTSINVHSIYSAGLFGYEGDETDSEQRSGFQLDIEHRSNQRIRVRRGETEYLVLNFTIYIDEIEGSVMMMAVPNIGFTYDAEDFGMPPPMLEMVSKWEPSAFKVEVDEMEDGATLDFKYLIWDYEGYSYLEDSSYPPEYDHDPVTIIVIVSFTADRSWRIREPKFYLTNFMFYSDSERNIQIHGPMVSVHVDEMSMSYEEFWEWAEEVQLPL